MQSSENIYISVHVSKTQDHIFSQKSNKTIIVVEDTNTKIYGCVKDDIGLHFIPVNITFHTSMNSKNIFNMVLSMAC